MLPDEQDAARLWDILTYAQEIIFRVATQNIPELIEAVRHLVPPIPPQTND